MKNTSEFVCYLPGFFDGAWKVRSVVSRDYQLVSNDGQVQFFGLMIDWEVVEFPGNGPCRTARSYLQTWPGLGDPSIDEAVHDLRRLLGQDVIFLSAKQESHWGGGLQVSQTQFKVSSRYSVVRNTISEAMESLEAPIMPMAPSTIQDHLLILDPTALPKRLTSQRPKVKLKLRADSEAWFPILNVLAKRQRRDRWLRVDWNLSLVKDSAFDKALDAFSPFVEQIDYFEDAISIEDPFTRIDALKSRGIAHAVDLHSGDPRELLKENSILICKPAVDDLAQWVKMVPHSTRIIMSHYLDHPSRAHRIEQWARILRSAGLRVDEWGGVHSALSLRVISVAPSSRCLWVSP